MSHKKTPAETGVCITWQLYKALKSETDLHNHKFTVSQMYFE